MKNITLTLLLLFYAMSAFAWNIKLDEEYLLTYIDGEIYIVNENNNSVIIPMQYYKGGDLTHYYNTKDYIYFRWRGRPPENMYSSDLSGDVVRYFFIDKILNQIVGPLTEANFVNDSRVGKIDPHSWIVPENPNLHSNRKSAILTILLSIIVICILVIIFRRRAKE